MIIEGFEFEEYEVLFLYLLHSEKQLDLQIFLKNFISYNLFLILGIIVSSFSTVVVWTTTLSEVWIQ